MSALPQAWQTQVDTVDRPDWASNRSVDIGRDPKTGEIWEVCVTDSLTIPVKDIESTTVTVERFFDVNEEDGVTRDPIKVFLEHAGIETVPTRNTIALTPDQLGPLIIALVKARLALTGANK